MVGYVVWWVGIVMSERLKPTLTSKAYFIFGDLGSTHGV